MELKEQLSGKRVYFDTNIVIYLVEGLIEYQSILDDLQELLSANDCEAVTSELTLCEALIRPFKIGSPEGITICRSFLEKSGVFDLVAPSRNILVQAAFVAGTTAMKTPDAIHIATALESKCEVMLTNDKKMKTYNRLGENIIIGLSIARVGWGARNEPRHPTYTGIHDGRSIDEVMSLGFVPQPNLYL